MSPPFLATVETCTTPQVEALQRYQRASFRVDDEETMLQEHLPLVKTVVGRLAMNLPAHVDKEELYSAGLIGLLNAVRHYDPSEQTSFETYARIRIRGAVLDELRRMDWVPRSVHVKARKIESAMEQLQQRDAAPPSDADVAATVGISVEEYRQWLEEVKPATFVSLDASADGDGEDGLMHGECVSDEGQPTPYDEVAQENLVQTISDRMQQLPEMQRKVLALYYLEDLRLREIAEVLGVTESRVCQIHSAAITGLRAYLSKFESSTANT